MIEVVNTLESSGIEIHDNPQKTSKAKLIKNSLKNKDEDLVYEFFNNLQAVKTPEVHSSKTIPIHKKFIGTKVERYLVTEDYDEAVRVAFLRINNRVKRIARLNKDGASLMTQAFSAKNPIIKINPMITKEDKDEQAGIMRIFEGSMLAFRNPPSHNDERGIDDDNVKYIMAIANYLMNILDVASK